MNKAIFHFHFFKNAGTSLDASFKANFTEKEWVTKEFPGNLIENRKQVKNWILENPRAKCFSSHTAALPVPILDHIQLLPVLFIRHPLDRIASVYAFEKKQGGNGFGAVLARNTSLKGYIETRNALGHDRQCRDFHVGLLAHMFSNEHGSEFERAKKAIEELPFVGLVEEFDESLQRLESWLATEGLTDISLKPVVQNVSRNTSISIEEKMEGFKKQLGDEFFDEIMVSNEQDMILYEMVKSRFSN
ncbi:sulfotransferase family 2 domain-containing protein [Paraglaciecola sp. L3A3]|uniref:sulfotransferase family 2 domain-containing protein n=1 Tax=Paraglaciecola sp. L3A3 TaxID=2686358 RepID=UPI00131E37E7|nr:sulfotransferase family 2 domain-containing protein [Paraglaciecola sp. L3A3]